MYKILYICCIIFFVLEGCAGWVALGYDNIFYTSIALLTISCWKMTYRSIRLSEMKKIVPFAVCLLIVYLISSRFQVLGSFAHLIRIFAFCTPFFIASSDQKDLLYKINRVFVILISLTLIMHFLKLTNLLPSFPAIQRGHYWYENYIVYLYSPDYGYKCCGFCYEPGFFSLLLSALLFINGYNVKKKHVILYLVALLMTLSLGGFVLTAVCWYLYYAIRKSGDIRQYLIRSFVFLAFFFASYHYVTYIWNDGNNVVNKWIVNKALNITSKGPTLESRQSYNAIILWNEFLGSNSTFFGYGLDKYKQLRSESDYYDAASIAEFVMANGYVGTLLYIFALVFFFLRDRKSFYSVIGLIFLLLDFIQHGYGIDSSMFILIGLSVNYMEKLSNLKDKKRMLARKIASTLSDPSYRH